MAATEEEVIKVIVNMKKLMSMTTHAHCRMCQYDTPVEQLGVPVTEFDDPDEFIDIIELVCCDDPYPQPMIISDKPLFPEDDKSSESNSYYYHFGTRKWHYDVGEDLLDLILNEHVPEHTERSGEPKHKST